MVIVRLDNPSASVFGFWFHWLARYCMRLCTASSALFLRLGMDHAVVQRDFISIGMDICLVDYSLYTCMFYIYIGYLAFT